ncbi:uncharacterized protein LACBIDRAFT_309113 [Laccaria bicolor S238N-H82]|uniref:Predicted protein n=1 Tax=Laccaria bicolor (strain S238N-H82 / ATCC MYA-4686) TaxID=486041 RepID=B0CVK8_LACBS|nr:uncharacterized protein LACBIDRAFT_309113 [Laccaria bicolor S238N-H82]EDR13350.1 predicted protein [Laccaria bicolor S238N-H82]|eukprot:XP_001875848.1 predicted protein [Laccaria bicolor S238N-H82]
MSPLSDIVPTQPCHNQHPDVVFGAHPNPQTQSVPTQASLSQATSLLHPSPAVPFHRRNWHPHCRPFKNQHPKLPHHPTTRHSRLALQPLRVVLLLLHESCTLTCMLWRAHINLGKWKAGFSFEVLFSPPSILPVM